MSTSWQQQTIDRLERDFGPIITLKDLKRALAHVLERGYHIDFDRKGNIIVMVYPDDFAMAEQIRERLACGVKHNIHLRKISFWRSFWHALTRKVSV